MEFIYKNRRIMVIILACLLIALALFQMYTGISFNDNLMKGIEYVVMFGALYLLLIVPKQYEKSHVKPLEEELDEENKTSLEVIDKKTEE